MRALIFDTETVGLVQRSLPSSHPSQPDVVQLAAALVDEKGEIRARFCTLVIPTVAIHPKAQEIHGISRELTERYGVTRRSALQSFHALVKQADFFVAHNLAFDAQVMQTMYHREGVGDPPSFKNGYCTMLNSVETCRIPHPNGRSGYKWPKLIEAYEILVDPKGFAGAHDALADVIACYEVFKRLRALPGYSGPT